MKTTVKQPTRRTSSASLSRSRKSSLRKKAAASPLRLTIKSILVPTDFSAASEKALAYAVPFARQFGAKLSLLHVVEPIATPDFARSFPLAMESGQVLAACKRHLKRIIKGLNIESRLLGKTLVCHGRSFNEIANVARKRKMDLIIISTHGFTGLKHALLGSTTERVVRHAPCPVLVVRPREREFVSTKR